MDVNELAALLHSKSAVRRSWRCPDENQLAAYVQKQLSTEKRRHLELHLADCTSCLQTIAFLATEDESTFLVPSQLVASARALVSRKSSSFWGWRWALATTAACLLVIGAFIIWKTRVQPPPKPPVDFVAQNTEPTQPGVIPTVTPRTETRSGIQKPKPTEPHAATVRGSSNNLQPTLILPLDGSVIRGLQRIRWSAVPDASSYEVKVVTEDGSPVLTQSTNETKLELKTATLAPGKYFVKVVAHLAGDRSVRSNSVSFRVVGP